MYVYCKKTISGMLSRATSFTFYLNHFTSFSVEKLKITFSQHMQRFNVYILFWVLDFPAQLQNTERRKAQLDDLSSSLVYGP